MEREKVDVDEAENVEEDEDEIASVIQRTYKTKGEPDRGDRTFASRLQVEIKGGPVALLNRTQWPSEIGRSIVLMSFVNWRPPIRRR